jgi:hypothetical protein
MMLAMSTVGAVKWSGRFQDPAIVAVRIVQNWCSMVLCMRVHPQHHSQKKRQMGPCLAKAVWKIAFQSQ